MPFELIAKSAVAD